MIFIGNQQVLLKTSSFKPLFALHHAHGGKLGHADYEFLETYETSWKHEGREYTIQIKPQRLDIRRIGHKHNSIKSKD